MPKAARNLSSTHLSGYHHHSSSILGKQHLSLYKICPRSSSEPMKQVRNSNLETRILDLKKKTGVSYCSSDPAHSPQNQTQKGIQVIGPYLGPWEYPSGPRIKALSNVSHGRWWSLISPSQINAWFIRKIRKKLLVNPVFTNGGRWPPKYSKGTQWKITLIRGVVWD